MDLMFCSAWFKKLNSKVRSPGKCLLRSGLFSLCSLRTREILKPRKWEILQWPSESPDVSFYSTLFIYWIQNWRHKEPQTHRCSKGLAEHLKGRNRCLVMCLDSKDLSGLSKFSLKFKVRSHFVCGVCFQKPLGSRTFGWSHIHILVHLWTFSAVLLAEVRGWWRPLVGSPSASKRSSLSLIFISEKWAECRLGH